MFIFNEKNIALARTCMTRRRLCVTTGAMAVTAAVLIVV